MKVNRSVLAMPLYLLVATTRADERTNMLFLVAANVSLLMSGAVLARQYDTHAGDNVAIDPPACDSC